MPTFGRTALSFQQVTVGATAVGLILGAGNPSQCRLSVQTNGVRVRWDGVDPTTTTGHLIQASAGAVDLTKTITITGTAALAAFRMIRDAAVDAVVAYTLET
jgi:hypothetical protein